MYGWGIGTPIAGADGTSGATLIVGGKPADTMPVIPAALASVAAPADATYTPNVMPIDPAQAASITFTKDIVPLLEQHCLKCHGGQDAEAGLDLKEAAMAVTAWARLYALRHDVAETGTLARLEALGASDVLPEASVQEAIEAYESLMRIRLRHQWPLHEDRQPANLVSPARMTRTEESLLRSAFAQITAMQKRISYDFLGGQS